jgi:hypothetical protein
VRLGRDIADTRRLLTSAGATAAGGKRQSRLIRSCKSVVLFEIAARKAEREVAQARRGPGVFGQSFRQRDMYAAVGGWLALAHGGECQFLSTRCSCFGIMQ